MYRGQEEEDWRIVALFDSEPLRRSNEARPSRTEATKN